MSDTMYSKEKLDAIEAETTLSFIDFGLWQRHVEKLARETGGMQVVGFALRWGKAMQYAIEADGCALSDVAWQLACDSSGAGLETQSYGRAVRLLENTWYYGDMLGSWYESL